MKTIIYENEKIMGLSQEDAFDIISEEFPNEIFFIKPLDNSKYELTFMTIEEFSNYLNEAFNDNTTKTN